MILASEDRYTPPDMIEATYRRAGEPKRLLRIPGGHYSVYHKPGQSQPATAAIGTPVAAWTLGTGGYATHATVPAWTAVPYPAELDPAKAVAAVLNIESRTASGRARSGIARRAAVLRGGDPRCDERGKSDDAVIVLEWTSVDTAWDRLTLTRPGSLHFPRPVDSGGPSGGDRRQARQPGPPCPGVLGDGAIHYTVAGLWTAARYSVPVTFIVANNRVRSAQAFAHLLGTPDAPYLQTGGIDIVTSHVATGSRLIDSNRSTRWRMSFAAR